MSVCLSVCLFPHGRLRLQLTDFNEIWHFCICRKYFENMIQVVLKSDDNDGYIYHNISLDSPQNDKLQRKTKPTIFCPLIFVPLENCSVHQIMWKKYGRDEQATDDNITGSIRFACWIPKPADTHIEYVMFLAFAQQQWLRESA